MQPPNRPGVPVYGRPPYGAPQYQGAPTYAPGMPPFQRPLPPRGPLGGLPRPSNVPIGGPRPPPPGIPSMKNTTLWIGKIAKTLDSDSVRQLLDACGPLKAWKPALDPKSGELRGFGFVTFVDAIGVLTALELLDNTLIDGQRLVLKCNSATDAHVKAVKADPNTAKSLELAVTTAKEKIEAITASRPVIENVVEEAEAAAMQFLTNLNGKDNGDQDNSRQPLQHEEGELDIEPAKTSSPPPPPAPVEMTILPTKMPAVVNMQRAPPRKRPLTSAFDDEDDDDEDAGRKSRKLIPIQYSGEERQEKQAVAPKPVVIDPEAERKKVLMARVPRNKEDIFRYSVKWTILDSAPQDVKSKISNWISKKIKSLVGDDEEGGEFADFVASEVFSHHSADKIFNDIKDILDEDAEEFLVQLFQLIIYQTEEIALKK